MHDVLPIDDRGFVVQGAVKKALEVVLVHARRRVLDEGVEVEVAEIGRLPFRQAPPWAEPYASALSEQDAEGRHGFPALLDHSLADGHRHRDRARPPSDCCPCR